MRWTLEEKERLKSLLDLGKTYTQASEIMSRSRGAIAAFVSQHKIYFASEPIVDMPPEFFLRSKPNRENTVIEHPPRDVPVPDGCLYIPFIDTEPGQCRYVMTDFWDETTHTSACCGLPVHDKAKRHGNRARSFCTHHYQWSIENEDQKNNG